MFEKNTYITRGINEQLSIDIIATLWMKVQNAKGRQLDYLQVFELTNGGTENEPVLTVKWSQEIPEHTETFYIRGAKTDVEKVWIICAGEGTDDEYSTMLLPEEY